MFTFAFGAARVCLSMPAAHRLACCIAGGSKPRAHIGFLGIIWLPSSMLLDWMIGWLAISPPKERPTPPCLGGTDALHPLHLRAGVGTAPSLLALSPPFFPTLKKAY